MTFLIIRDPRYANNEGIAVGRSEPEVRQAIDRLRREGYDVVRITPPLIGLQS